MIRMIFIIIAVATGIAFRIHNLRLDWDVKKNNAYFVEE